MTLFGAMMSILFGIVFLCLGVAFYAVIQLMKEEKEREAAANNNAPSPQQEQPSVEEEALP